MLLQVLANKPTSIAQYIEDDDINILLLQEGVYLLPQLLHQISAHRLFVLEHDWLASGLAHQSIFKNKRVNLISPAQWVAMTAEHFNVVTIQ
jgi:sulfur relay protein TusB/DsrH